MNWLWHILATVFLFWAMALTAVSYNMEDWRITWVQRVLAIFLISFAIGMINVNALS